MNVRKLALPLLALPLMLTACGEDGGGAGLGNMLPADPAYFSGQLFECADNQNPTSPPNCPPFDCDVDIEGRVSNCAVACNTWPGALYYCTVFKGPEGVDLCVPSLCWVASDGSTTCDDEVCDDFDTTCYQMDQFDSSCGY